MPRVEVNDTITVLVVHLLWCLAGHHHGAISHRCSCSELNQHTLLNQQKTWGQWKDVKKVNRETNIFTSSGATKQAWFLMDPGPVRGVDDGWWRCIPTAILPAGGALASSASFIQLPTFQ